MMAGCDTDPVTGDYYAAHKKVTRWAIVAGVLAAIATYLHLAGATFGVAIAGLPAVLLLGAVALAFLAGATIGVFIGFAANWFDRLHEQRPRTITVAGCIVCAGKNRGIQPFNDNDWTFNVADPLRLVSPSISGLDENEILTRGAPGSGVSTASRIVDPGSGLLAFHCEIASYVGNLGAIGGAVGAVAGAIAGAVIGAAICAGLAIATLGLAIAVCALIVALAVFLGAAAGGFGGAALGSLIGHGLDALSDFDERGEAITEGCQMFLTGRWVTDSSHEHNEIHDIEAATIIECGLECGGIDSAGFALTFAAAVGTGRHPAGVDP
jgi:MFS family permease